MFLKALLPNSQAKFANQYFAAIAAGLIQFTACLGLGWQAPYAIRLENLFQLTESQVQTLPIIFQICCLVGIVVSGYISNVFGRKIAIISLLIPHAAGLVLISLADINIWILYVYRCLAGYTFGAIFSVVPAYICEISSPNIRGILTSLASILLQVGNVFEAVVIPMVSFKQNALICLAFTVLAGVLMLIFPESPYWLLTDSQIKKAEKSLKFYRQSDNVEKELTEMHINIEREKEERGSMWDLVRISTNRKALLILLYVFLAQQLSGANMFVQYSQDMMKRAHSDISVDLSGMIYTLTSIVFGLLFCPLADIFGRRPLIIVSAALQGLPVLAMGLFFYFLDHGGNFISDMRALPFVALIVYNMTYSIGLMTIPYALMTELFPTNVRSQAGVVVSLYGSFLGLVVVFAFKTFNDIFSEFSLIFFVTAVICFICAVLAVFIVPETKGLTLEEIQAKLRGDRK